MNDIINGTMLMIPLAVIIAPTFARVDLPYKRDDSFTDDKDQLVFMALLLYSFALAFVGMYLIFRGMV